MKKNTFCKVNFNTENVLQTEVITDRLRIVPVRAEYMQNFIQLFGDSRVMKTYETGEPKSPEVIVAKYTDFINRWHEGNPFSAYMLLNKNSQEFIGVVNVSSRGPGILEVGSAICHKDSIKGYGTEAAHALFYSLFPRLMLRGYMVKGHPL